MSLEQKYFDLWRERIYQIKYREYLDDLAEQEDEDNDYGDLCEESSGYAVGTHYSYHTGWRSIK